jgi:hypothetical protein
MNGHQNGRECLPQNVDGAQPTLQKRVGFPRLARWIALFIVTCIVAMVTYDHTEQVSRLRQASANIHAGDTRADVLSRLGQPPIEYVRAFPEQGGPASVVGVSYGGHLNSLRQMIDQLVYSACDGFPEWYGRYVAQDAREWPIVIEFDTTGIVTSVRR